MNYTKKSYKSVEYTLSPPGYVILLDGKAALTPLGAPYVLASAALAQAIAEEWNQQAEFVRTDTMPLTRIVAVALDLSEHRREKLTAELLDYAETDLVCYRAGDIPELFSRQAQLLDPVRGWAEERFAIALKVADGVMPVQQPAANKIHLAAAIADYDAYRFAALASVVGPLGSLILALALLERRIDAAEAFALAHLEEAYETEKWGSDQEKDLRLKRLEKEVRAVEDFLSLALSSQIIL